MRPQGYRPAGWLRHDTQTLRSRSARFCSAAKTALTRMCSRLASFALRLSPDWNEARRVQTSRLAVARKRSGFVRLTYLHAMVASAPTFRCVLAPLLLQVREILARKAPVLTFTEEPAPASSAARDQPLPENGAARRAPGRAASWSRCRSLPPLLRTRFSGRRENCAPLQGRCELGAAAADDR
jgi:hypothetical protein